MCDSHLFAWQCAFVIEHRKQQQQQQQQQRRQQQRQQQRQRQQQQQQEEANKNESNRGFNICLGNQLLKQSEQVPWFNNVGNICVNLASSWPSCAAA